MWPIVRSLDLIRYLIVWRVHTSMLWLPATPVAEISYVLGTLIAERLPTRQARDWHKVLASWPSPPHQLAEFPAELETGWPLKSTLFVHPLPKRTFVRGERLVWELKLFAEHADHGLFLETVLPAMEQASTSTDPRWFRGTGLWGGFDLEAIYVARGPDWIPVAEKGQLDLSLQVHPHQWQEGLNWEPGEKAPTCLEWVTPFGLPGKSGPSINRGSGRSRRGRSIKLTPAQLLDALLRRLAGLRPGKYGTVEDVWNDLDPEERDRLAAVQELAAQTVPLTTRLRKASRKDPGQWIGRQQFDPLPPDLVPYLELASILHIGRQTHFGCGTFRLY